MSGATPSHSLDLAQWVKALEECLRGTDIALLQVQLPGVNLRLQCDVAGQAPAKAPQHKAAQATAVQAPSAPPAPLSPALLLVRAGSVGVLRLGHPLHAQPLVRSGQAVDIGQALALLQIGAVMLPVLAPCAGRVGRVLAQDGEIVGYGSLLLEIETGTEQERVDAD
jgi:acetyl-CoA carboxylase biotin carboxyl carrier protein